MRKIIFCLFLTTSVAAIAAPMDTIITFSGVVTSNGNWQAKYGNDAAIGAPIAATLKIDSSFTDPSMLPLTYCYNTTCSYNSDGDIGNPFGPITYQLGNINFFASYKGAPDHIQHTVSVYNDDTYQNSLIDQIIFYDAVEQTTDYPGDALLDIPPSPASLNNSTFVLRFSPSTFSSSSLNDAWDSAKLLAGPASGFGQYEGEYGTLRFSITNWSVATVPLPSSFLLMGSSLIALIRLTRIKK